MSWRGWVVRVVRFGFGAAIAVSFALLVTVQVRQRMFRHRAERLLADVQALDFHKSTFADAAVMMRRWGKWGRYEGACTSTACTYAIRLKIEPPSLYRVVPYLDRVIGEDGWDAVNARYQRIYSTLGGLLAGVGAEFIVEDGFVQRKSFSVLVDVPEGSYKPEVPDGFSGDYWLLGRVSSQGSLLGGLGNEAQLARHPDYKVGSPGGCTNCISTNVVFSPDIDQATGRSLMAYDLSCLVGPAHCSKATDLLPVAARKQLEDRANDEDDPKSCRVPLEVLGRDLDDIDVVDATADWPAGDVPKDGRVRVVSVVRGSGGVVPGQYRPLFTGWRYSANLAVLAKTAVRAGHRYIWFDFGRERPRHYFSHAELGLCGAIDYSDEALAAMRRGIARSSRIRSTELMSWGSRWFYEEEKP